MALSAKIKIKKGEKPPSQEPLQKKKGEWGKKKRQMYTQILSKNELVINAAEEKGEGRREKKKRKTNKTKTNGHGKHGEKKVKTGGTTIELPTNTPALSTKQNKYDAKNQ